MPGRRRKPGQPKAQSGAQGRAKRKARLEEERRRQGLTVERYREIGGPPPGAVGRGMWAGRQLAALAWNTLLDETIDEPTRRKQAGELLDKLNRGMPKALYEEEIEELRRQLTGALEAGRGASTAETLPEAGEGPLRAEGPRGGADPDSSPTRLSS